MFEEDLIETRIIIHIRYDTAVENRRLSGERGAWNFGRSPRVSRGRRRA